MQANELRVGNWVLYKGKYVQVNANTILAIANGSDHYKPIELSPEILEECGFVERKSIIGDTRVLSIDYVDYRLGNTVATVIKSGTEIEFAPDFGTIEDRSYITTVHYLHQLQNLYYSLTNTELTWNRKQ